MDTSSPSHCGPEAEADPPSPGVISVGLIDNDPMILGSAGSWLAGHDPGIEIRHVAAGVAGYLALDHLGLLE